MNNNEYDVIVVGAGAAGLMAAATAAKYGKKLLLLEANNKIGEKIRISGGGRCNFTNINATADNYLSNNPHFVKSALAQYDQYDFIKLVEHYNISYHEKTLGQLFCDHSSTQIIDMLVNECRKYNVQIQLGTKIHNINKNNEFYLNSNQGDFIARSLIIATGGLSIPKLGASDFGYRVAKRFGLKVIAPKPGLVPLTVRSEDLEIYKTLSGIAIESVVSYQNASFRENILFTHRGLSGPAILQISSYLAKADQISINLLPDVNLKAILLENRNSRALLTNVMKSYLPNRFVDNFVQSKRIVDYTPKALELIAENMHKFLVNIEDTEGYAKAEVTIGGVDTLELSSKTMEAKKVANLYFIGEVVDVTGWLGGYNFQWAWSSGHVAGKSVH